MPLASQAMDRAYCLARMIDDMLDRHPGIEGNARATDLLETVQAAIWSLYEELGGRELC